MQIFSSCVLITTFAVLASSVAAPAPIPQNDNVCVGGVVKPIATIDYIFRIRAIPTTAQTPSFDLGYILTGDTYPLVLGQNILPFNLTNNVLTSTDPRFEKFAVGGVPDGLGLKLVSDFKFSQVQRCVGNTPVNILDLTIPFWGIATKPKLFVQVIKAGQFVKPAQGQVPPGTTEVFLQVVPT